MWRKVLIQLNIELSIFSWDRYLKVKSDPFMIFYHDSNCRLR